MFNMKLFNSKQLRKYLRSGSLAQEAAEALQRIEISKAILGLEITKLWKMALPSRTADRKASSHRDRGPAGRRGRTSTSIHMFVEHERPVADEERRVIGNCEPKTNKF